jgi:hypothetical protein
MKNKIDGCCAAINKENNKGVMEYGSTTDAYHTFFLPLWKQE